MIYFPVCKTLKKKKKKNCQTSHAIRHRVSLTIEVGCFCLGYDIYSLVLNRQTEQKKITRELASNSI